VSPIDLRGCVRGCCPYPQLEKCRACNCWKRCVFNFLSGAAKRRFQKRRRIYNLRPRQLIFREGETPRGFFVLCTGHIRLFKRNEHERQLTLSYVACGELFGAASYFAKVPYHSTAEAVRDSIVCHVPAALIESDFRRSRDFMDRLTAHLSSDICSMMDRAKAWGLQSADARLAEFLLSIRYPQSEWGAPECSGIGTDYNRTEISQCVGLARETVVRRLQSFQQRGLIGLDGRKITILDRTKLARVLVES
jgi:CRP/FNR family transcriptional regulator